LHRDEKTTAWINPEIEMLVIGSLKKKGTISPMTHNHPKDGKSLRIDKWVVVFLKEMATRIVIQQPKRFIRFDI
jgi:hypothetical protein